MKQLKMLVILWGLFFTIGNAHAFIVTDTISGTVSQFLDATDYSGLDLSTPKFTKDFQGNIIDPRIISGITVIDLFEITYNTDLKKPVGTSGTFLIDDLISLTWSGSMMDLLYDNHNPIPYGGGTLPWISPQGAGPFVVLNSAEQATRYQFSDELNGIETTVWSFWADGSAVTMHSLIGHKTALKFSDITVATSSVPVPGTLGLLTIGLLTIIGLCRKRYPKG